jgi:dihydrofolate synthase/folylpolyglutamate synthase
LLAFKEEQIDLAILETGLGGRLDSTTTACAEVVAITPIALDHQEDLGTTLAEIASEKAAVVRPGIDVVIAPQPQIAFDVLRERCLKCYVNPRLATSNVKVINQDSRGRMCVTFETSEGMYENVRVKLPGRHQIVNASVAIGLAEVLKSHGFEISNDAIIAGLETCAHPGRLEWRTGARTILLDGAHNVAGAHALREYLDEFVDAPLTIVFGGMRDKELVEIAALLFPLATNINLTEINSPRTATQESLAELVRHEGYPARARIFTNSGDALSAAIEQTPPDGVICVTGSLYLIGEVQTILRHEERPTFTT